jgi:anti-anti-sigma factor
MLALSHETFRQIMNEVIAVQPTECILDIANVSFMDSGGLGMLLLARDTFAAKGIALIIRRPTGAVKRLLNLAKFDQLLKIEE